MRSTIIMKTLLPLAVIAFVAIIGFKYTQPASAAGFFGAIYTTIYDGTGVDVNIYDDDDDVYLNGGPQNQNGNGLPNGTYYFQVTDPSGSSLLSTDAAECRQLLVSGGVISGATGPACKHPNGLLNSANNSMSVKLAPFSPTPNAGGEYKVWLIRQASTTTVAEDGIHINFTSNNSKTDNFRIRDFCETHPDDQTCNENPPDVFLSGHKFYDANANTLDDDNQDVAGIQIVISFTTPAGSFGPFTTTTDSNGDWTYGPIPAGASYTVTENVPCVDGNNDLACDVGSYWVETAPVADGTGFQGYTGVANTNVGGLNFGNVCFYPASGGLTLGYWSNKNGQKVMTNGGPYGIDPNTYPVFGSTDVPPNPMPGLDGTGMPKDLMFLQRLNLKESSTSRRFPNGDNFDPPNYDRFNSWLLNGNAVNMSYMLSVQLSATSLDVRHKFLFDSQIVDARTVCNSIGDCFDFTSIGAIRVLANQSLDNYSLTVSGSPWRDSQEQMKNFLDGVNNNRLPFASASPCSVFYPLPVSPAPLSGK
ncbi:MAG TPA: hypothetical protein VNB22_16900 [Pyrinomonadaceae bacterium]|nr:hypothetical protein [Pyrinomonadaceae bacterium]